MQSSPPNGNGTAQAAARLSYKFQRLREQLRSAVLTGEFTGRLPGERELGRRYRANAKTINKALCDLASEGLVIRHIGRGTFVANGHSGSEGHAGSKAFVVVQEASPSVLRQNILERVEAALASEGHRVIADHGEAPRGANGVVGRHVPRWNQADGVIHVSTDPFSGRGGVLSDSQIVDIIRRQIPLVLVGASADKAKVNAVVPDHVDAGYRVCEHLLQSGYDSIAMVTSDATSPAIELVLNGARTAAARHQRPVHHLVAAGSQNGHAAAWERLSAAKNVGVVCVGEAALQAALHNPMIREASHSNAIGLAAILEPGSAAARVSNITYYEVSPDRMAALAARLLADWRPAHRPVEVIVPGVLRVLSSGRGKRPAEPNRLRSEEPLAEVSI